MSPRRILITGFGPFEELAENPSGRLAELLARSAPDGLAVHAVVLPVSFARAPLELGRALERVATSVGPPELLLGLGVHRGEGFRVELAARARLTRTERPDVDGRVAAEGPHGAAGDLRSPLVERLRKAVEGRAGWWLSEDAGGYVCERTYHALLEVGARDGVPAAFVHVPTEERVPLAAQTEELSWLLRELPV